MDWENLVENSTKQLEDKSIIMIIKGLVYSNQLNLAKKQISKLLEEANVYTD
jgi:hypothetical protein